MNAILASASRHIAWISKVEDTESGKYHDKCLQILIPLLDNPVNVLDDNLFAAMVVLRQYEEYDGKALQLFIYDLLNSGQWLTRGAIYLARPEWSTH